MAILRTQLQGTGTVSHYLNESGKSLSRTRGVRDGIVETAADLAAADAAAFAPGSLSYCLEDHRIYVKSEAGQWKAVTE